MRKPCFVCLLTLIASLFSVVTISAQDVLGLDGSWDLSLNDSTHYDDYVMLPGSLQTNGKGGSKFVGKAWYRKGVYIPRDWRKQRVTLFLERPHAGTTVYINGKEIGHQTSRFTPHLYDVTQHLVAGYRNTIAVCVNTSECNGVSGRMELLTQPREISIKQVRINPEPVDGFLQMTVWFDSEHHPATYFEDMVIMIVPDDKKEEISFMATEDITSRKMDLRIPIGSVFALWDEFSPKLYRMGIRVGDDYYETTFGLRTVKSADKRLSVNGRPLWLRGTLENGFFPKTASPPADESSWTDIFTKVKGYGLNHVRFRTYCPPDAAFDAADKLGVYLLFEGAITPEEQKSISDTYGHHPSLVMMPTGDAGDGWNCPMITCGQNQEEQMSCYKQQVECNLLSKDEVGFLLPSLNDCCRFPAKDWCEFCSPLVPLARFPKSDYTTADTLQVPVEVYNALYGNISPIRKTYFITEGERVITGGGLSSDSIPMGKNCAIGTVVYPLDSISKPSKLTLTVRIGKEVVNHWDFWVRSEAPKQEDNLNE